MNIGSIILIIILSLISILWLLTIFLLRYEEKRKVFLEHLKNLGENLKPLVDDLKKKIKK